MSADAPPAVVYEVMVSVDEDALPEYAPWITAHVEEMMTFDGFLSAQLVESDDPTPGPHSTKPQVQGCAV